MKLKFFPNWNKLVTSITKGWSNPLLESPLRNLGTTSLLYHKFCSTYLHTSASGVLHKKIREIERNDTHAVKWIKR